MNANAEVSGVTLRTPVGVILALVGFVFAVLIVISVARDYYPIYYWDEWGYVSSLLNGLHGGVSGFIVALHERHNEHRLALVKLLMLLDVKGLVPEARFFLSIVNVAAFFLVGCLVAYIAGDAPRRSFVAVFICFFMGVAMVTPVNAENLRWPSQLQFPLSSAITVLYLWWAVKPGRAARDLVLGSLCFAILGIYAMASGVVVPFIVAAIYWMSFRDSRRAGLIAATGIASLAIFLLNAGSDGGKAITHLAFGLSGVGFALAYAGAYFQHWGVATCQTVGFLAVLLALFNVASSIRRKFFSHLELSRREVVAVGVTVYFLIGVVIVGLTRSSSGIASNALVSRYAANSGLLLALGVIPFGVTSLRKKVLIAVLTVILVCIGYLPTAQRAMYDDIASYMREVSYAIGSGVYDEELYRHAYPSPQSMRAIVQELRAINPAFDSFAGPARLHEVLAALDGRTVDSLGQCIGSVDAVFSLGGSATRVVGHFPQAQIYVPKYVVMFKNGIPVGWTETFRSRLTLPQSEFRLLMQLSVDHSVYTLVGLDGFGGGCKLRVDMPSTPPGVIPLEGHLSTYLRAAYVIADSAGFRSSGFSGFQPPLINGVSHYLVSKVDGGEGVGDLAYDVSIPLQGPTTMVIPLINGENPLTSEVDVSTTQGKSLVSVTPVFPTHNSWYGLLVPVGELKGQTIRVRVKDKGNAWGNWIGVGEPLLAELPDVGGSI